MWRRGIFRGVMRDRGMVRGSRRSIVRNAFVCNISHVTTVIIGNMISHSLDSAIGE